MGSKFSYELPNGGVVEVTNGPQKSIRKTEEKNFLKGEDSISTLAPKASIPFGKRVKKK